MTKRMIALCVFMAILNLGSLAYSEPSQQIYSALSWLTSQQSIDGSWSSTADTSFGSTTSVADTLFLFYAKDTPYTNALSWAASQEIDNARYLVFRIRSIAPSGADISFDLNNLLSYQISDGGFGEYPGGTSGVSYTALALQALRSVNYTDTTIINPALAYLTGTQNPDGGWGFYQGDASNVYMTAVVSATLQQFPQMTTIATAVNKATMFLLAHQNADGGFGGSPSTVFETALAYIALVGDGRTQGSPLQNAVNYLTSTQSANGSWNDDPYSTALALRALHFSENKPSPPPPPPPGGSITGTVVDSVTMVRVGGVAVVLGGNSLINTTTDSSGNFTLSDVPPGAHTVSFSLSGYASKAASAGVAVDTVTNLGYVQLLSSYSTGTIAGIIRNAEGKPLAEVAVTVAGAWSGNAVTGADGGYSFSYVTPGEVTITAAKSGYQSATATGRVYPRTTLTVSPRLSATPPQSGTGTLVGRVVDSVWGLPIDHLPEEKGVTVTLSGGVSVEPDPDNGGYFSIPNLAPNTYQVTIGMRGFTGKAFRVVISPGTTTDLGTVRLEMSMSEMTLTGTVTDASTGAPIPGAELTISAKGLTGRTDFAGGYAIAGIKVPSEFTLKVSAGGYTGKSFTVRSSNFIQTMNLSLSPTVTTGSLTGTVVEEATGAPVSGATLTLAGSPSVSATTDSMGAFAFSDVPKGSRQITLSSVGYAPRTITTAIAAGAVNDVGRIGLAAHQLPASIQGTVRDAVAKAPLAGVEIRAAGTGSLQSPTAADGSYRFTDVTPGTVTVAATAPAGTGYYGARFTGELAPGGVLVFSPALSKFVPADVTVRVMTGKPVYQVNEVLNISVTLWNAVSQEAAAFLLVRVTDPAGTSIYETDAAVDLEADGTAERSFSFALPPAGQGGTYTVRSELYGASGVLLGTGTTGFGMAVSQISVTPALPASFSVGSNTVTFKLTNQGTLPVTAGSFGITLTDPEGQVVATAAREFSLGLGESDTLSLPVSLPGVKLGTYLLSYAQSDETGASQKSDIAVPSALTIAPFFGSNTYRARETATLTVTLTNAGRFSFDALGAGIAVTAAVPDAGYAETKLLAAAPAAGDAAGSTLLYRFVVPESITVGQHGVRITATLPSGSTQVQTAQLAIPESALSLAPIQGAQVAGGTISAAIANSGGVDAPVLYTLSLYDAKSALIARKSSTETAPAGSSLNLALPIPDGAVDGAYNLVVQFKDLKTGKEESLPNPIAISGVKGALQVRTDKESYLLPEEVTALSTITNSGASSLSNGNLHLQVVTVAGSQAQKPWTSQYDFQQGVRNGLDTYGVNDWIIPDDDFDSPEIDQNRWSSWGSASIQAGKLLVDSSQASSGLTSKWELEGDFDIQVDFSNNNSVDRKGAELLLSGGAFYLFIKNSAAHGYQSSININGTDVVTRATGGVVASGSYRIQRIGNTITTFYAANSKWVELLRASYPEVSGLVRVNPYMWGGFTSTNTRTEFDNFKLNSGRIKTENQTVDSVRLLPLNDNFDDGVLNMDRWVSYNTKNALLYESNGRLNMESILTGQFVSVGVYSKYFSGDVTGKVKYGLLTWQNQNTHKLAISFGTSTASFYYVERIYDSRFGGNGYLTDFKGLPISSLVPSTDATGALSISRVGTDITGSYLKQNVWTTLRKANLNLGTLYFDLGMWSDANFPNPITKIYFDNFQMDNRGKYTSYGTLTEIFDAGAMTRFSNISWTSIVPTATAIKFRVRTADMESKLSSAAWSDYITASGSPITSPPGRWIEVEATLETTDPNVTPLLHDITVTYGNNPGDILWETDVPVTLAQGALSDLNNAIPALGVPGKYYLQGILTTSTGQTVASGEYPFYVEQGTIELRLATDKKMYRPGETVRVAGEVGNLSTLDAAGLVLKIQGSGSSGTGTLYSETIDVAANGSHPFSFTTIAGSDGSYGLSGAVTLNSTTLASVGDQYHSASPVIAATVSAPDTAGTDPFTVSVTLSNTGKVAATLDVRITDDSGALLDNRQVALSAGESKVLQYTRQIAGTTVYTAAFSGDLSQTITRTVAFEAPASAAATVSVGAQVVVDRASYVPNQQVIVTATTTNLSATAMAENLTAWTAVINSEGQALHSGKTLLSSLVPGQVVALKSYWNTGTSPAGSYLVKLEIRDAAGRHLAGASRDLVIGSTMKPSALLKGEISLNRQSIVTGEPVIVSYGVTNTGNVELGDIALSIQTVDLKEQSAFGSISDWATLAMGAKHEQSGVIDTQSYSARDYLVVLRATIDGVEETLAGTYFRVEGAPSAPALYGPVGGSDVASFTPSLAVSNASDPNGDAISYHFELYADSGMTLPVGSGTVAETAGVTNWTVAAPLVENRVYYWRARAHDGKLYGPWTAAASFRVNTLQDPPSAPVVSSPSDGTAVSLLTPTLTVGNATDPDSGNLTYNFEVALDQEFGNTVASVRGIAEGVGSTSWMVPVSLQENAWYYWRAQADDWLVEGEWSVPARFLVNTWNDSPSTPAITAPGNGSSVPALDVQIVAGNAQDPDSPALSYFFELDTVPSFDSARLLRSESVSEGDGHTAWRATGLSDNTRYWVRVKASDGTADSPWSEAVAFFANTANDPPATPILANPSQGAGVNLLTPTLSVYNASDPDQEIPSYQFELYADAAMTNLVAGAESVVETAQMTGWTVPVPLAENQSYYWRARAYDGSLHSGWSPATWFVVNTANDAPGAPGISAPAAGSSVATLSPTLTVTNAADPDSGSLAYQFEIYSGGALVAAAGDVTEGNSGSTSWTPSPPLADDTIYQWRARASDGDSFGPWTALSSFTVHIPVASINATIDFDPDTLNRSSKGSWVVVYIELPDGYRAADIDVTSLRLAGAIAAESRPYAVGDHDQDGIADLMVKFKRSEVVNLLSNGEQVPVQVTGKVGATPFEGVDVIRVIQ